MPWYDFICACGCGVPCRAYRARGQPAPRYATWDCASRALRAKGIKRGPSAGARYPKYRLTPDMRTALRQVWRGVDPPRVRYRWLLELAPEFSAIPKRVIRYHAGQLGLTWERKDAKWTREECRIFGRLAGEESAMGIQRQLAATGHHRTLRAIAARLHAMRLPVRGNTWSVPQISRLLGWSEPTVLKWITDGALVAERNGVDARVAPDDLAEFVRREAGRLSERRVDLERLVLLLDESSVGEKGG